jgi:hypothetical protein
MIHVFLFRLQFLGCAFTFGKSRLSSAFWMSLETLRCLRWIHFSGKKHALNMHQIKSLSADSDGFEGSLNRGTSLRLVAKAWQYALMYFRASSFSTLDDWMRSSTFPARIAQNT